MSIAASAKLASINPATGEVVGEVPITPPAEVEGVVMRARNAQRAWGGLSLEERIAVLGKAGSKLVERSAELGALLTREMGKPMREAVGEVESCGRGMAEELVEIGNALSSEIVEDSRARSTIYRDPFGVCAAISPWNFPLAMPHSMVIPALAAGNTVVLKPSEETPLIAKAYVDLLNEDLPSEVLQIVQGGDEQGKALVAAPVDLIAFTGSREAGKNILQAAAPGLKRVILELGGKDPMIVLEDADLEKAARFAVHNSFRNAGQVCVSTERIFVSEKIADRFEELMSRYTEELVVGRGDEEGVQVGPMINTRQRDHVLQQIETALSQGARLVSGGKGHRDLTVMPTVLSDLRPDMSIMRDETFGPVACISRFHTPEEAVDLANDTPYGLGAVVFGGDQTRAHEVARKLTAGMIGINKSCGGAFGAPWVGAKESGYGFHSSRDGHRQFAQVRVVTTPGE